MVAHPTIKYVRDPEFHLSFPTRIVGDISPLPHTPQKNSPQNFNPHFIPYHLCQSACKDIQLSYQNQSPSLSH